ncbi:hypothetical protein MTR_8g064900 [Medicago truncatula]|uniref:Uncharacterized protein n=1 Tax=Medicago truncatula TaxID=3880 RepID=A0A072TS61_MEDTR|nr:hypothetical protein MTR_8g064900 [Medicago truncatula]
MAQNSLNIGLHRPNFVSPLSEHVLQTELPKGWKIPKFTTFDGDTKCPHLVHYPSTAFNSAFDAFGKESQLVVIHGEIDQNRNKSPKEENCEEMEKFLRVKNRATFKIACGTICERGTKDSTKKSSKK